jgi:succinate dehydrogenase / fumarate reductase, cytochrome b subunit
MASHDRPLSPHLQIYRWQWTMTLSILHRATGVALVAGAFGVVWWLLALAGSPEDYRRFADCLASPLGMVATGGFLACLAFHFFNGIRHLLWDTGWGLDIPTAFRTAWIVIVLSLVSFAVLAWLVLGGRP